jgi:hypothetical protein
VKAANVRLWDKADIALLSISLTLTYRNTCFAIDDIINLCLRNAHIVLGSSGELWMLSPASHTRQLNRPRKTRPPLLLADKAARRAAELGPSLFLQRSGLPLRAKPLALGGSAPPDYFWMVQ